MVLLGMSVKGPLKRKKFIPTKPKNAKSSTHK